MTSPVTPPAVILPSAYPALGSSTFNQDAYNAATSLPAALTRQGEIAEATKTNADSALESASLAVGAALTAATARDTALAAANFKGLWPSLTGALNKPASVKHNGRFWALLNNLADVTTSQPGVSTDWTSLDSGSVQQEVTTSTTMLPGVRYVVKAAGVTLTAPLPASLQAGDPVRAVDAFGSGFTANWNGNSVKGDTQSVPMAIPAYCGFDLYFSGSTLA